MAEKTDGRTQPAVDSRTMYVHLGGELVVAVREVVAVLDARLVAAAEVNQEFIDRAEAAGRVRGGVLTPACKSLVVTRDLTVYPSGIAPATLARRMTHSRRSARAWDAQT